jgi:hypothetical protein
MANEVRKTFVPKAENVEKHSLRPMNTTLPPKPPEAPRTPPSTEKPSPGGPQEKK